jgi:GNAT superfamily N-acetyltransferase
MTIRKATASDAKALAVLLGELGYPTEARELPARLKRFTANGASRVLVAVEERVVVGFAALELTFPIHQLDPVAHLSAFAVASAARRRGVGRALMAAVDAEARQRGCQRLVVTSAERRADAHAFYLATGWVLTGRHFGKAV